MTVDWIALDWGHETFRAWAMDASGKARAEVVSDSGSDHLTPDEFEPALIKAVSHWLGDGVTQIVAAGTLAGRDGWVKPDMCTVPCDPLGAGYVAAPCRDKRIKVSVVPGLQQIKPTEVTHGAGVRIAGLIAAYPKFDGIVLLPEDTSVWAHISAGEVVSFRTAMTTELCALIAGSSSLKRACGHSSSINEGVFLETVSETMSRPERIALSLRGIFALAELGECDGATANAQLWGAIIGAELAATKPYWLGQALAIVGAGRTAELYSKALEAQGVFAQHADEAEMTVRGLHAAYTRMVTPKGQQTVH